MKFRWRKEVGCLLTSYGLNREAIALIEIGMREKTVKLKVADDAALEQEN